MPRSSLFTCFVDFKSAFDSVWREALLVKLYAVGIRGRIWEIIKDMYKEVFYRVKVDGGLTEEFSSTIGVKQGCVLSPILFKLFIADIVNIFDGSCDPVSLGSSKISCLCYADDIVILSESADGLQKCLDKLSSYCEKWGLSVNVSKTQVLIFNKGGHRFSRYRFLLGDQELKIVQEYCYLGIIFSAGGNFTKALENLNDKARKAFFAFRKYDKFGNAKLSFKFFDTLVKPILTYSSEVITPFYTHSLSCENFTRLCEEFPVEVFNMNLCKSLLGISWKRKPTSLAVRGECGRFPIFIDCMLRSVSYYNRLVRLHESGSSSLVSVAFAESAELKDNYSWRKLVASFHSKLNIDVNSFNRNVINDFYVKRWHEQISRPGSKHLYLSQVKPNFNLEPYVQTIPLNLRKNFALLRTSSHCLEIEVQRYVRGDKTRPARDKRLCKLCKTEVEDERHFLIRCPYYEDTRKEFFQKLNQDVPLVNNLDTGVHESTFLMLFGYNKSCYKFAKPLITYVNTLFEQRRDFFELTKSAFPHIEKSTETRSGRQVRVPARFRE